jgi:cytochrome c-type protein NapC
VATTFAPLGLVALVCAGIAAVLLVAYLVVRPPLDGPAKAWLFFALGVFPLGAAFAGNVHGFETTKARTFCGSCHVMGGHAADAADGASRSLASRHSRNALFGDQSCYVCHADYGMYGTVVTKLGGMGHVWRYYAEGYRAMPLDEAQRTIRIARPFPNTNCMQCHTTRGDVWLATADHRSSLDEVRAGRVSCASPGCHGFAHPFSKSPEEETRAAARPDGGAATEGGAP